MKGQQGPGRITMNELSQDTEPPGSATEHPCAIELLDPRRLLTPLQAGALTDLATRALAHLNHPGEVRVRLVDDQEMAAAHQKYANIPGTTDVLTFDLAEGRAAHGQDLDVDILACVDEARRQAATAPRDHPIEHELLLYILHGVLHCLGHDDHEDDAYAKMHAEEDRILTAIGVGPVFAQASATGIPPVSQSEGAA